MLRRLEQRTKELETAHARLRDPDCEDFLEFPEPEPEPKKVSDAEVAKGKELVSEQVQTASEAVSSLHPPAPVLHAPADQSVPDVGTQVGLVEDGLRTAGVNSVVIPSACSFADDDNFGCWMDVKARQMSESVRRLRKQVLTDVVTLAREFCSRRRPRLLVGTQQGAILPGLLHYCKVIVVLKTSHLLQQNQRRLKASKNGEGVQQQLAI